MTCIAQDPITGNCFQLHIQDNLIDEVKAVRSQGTGLLMTPGFCDLQVNGGFGVDLNSRNLTVEKVIQLNHQMLHHGITSWCPTIITADQDIMRQSLRVVAESCRQDLLVQQCVIGIHLEGPFISPIDGARGAHPRKFIQNPDIGVFQSLQSAASGRIRLVTIAPEQDGAVDLIRYLTGQGIIVALGHTLASRTQIESAVLAGATLATHLGNGLPAQLDRHTNPLLHMLVDERLFASVIFDGHHLPVDLRTLIRKTKEIEQMLMISDATRLVGMPPGIYDEPIGGQVELSAEGRLSLAGTPYLAGAAMTLLEDANFLLEMGEFSLEEIIQMAMTQPRELVGHEQNSTVLLRQDSKTNQIKVVMTAIDGEIVYNKESKNEYRADQTI